MVQKIILIPALAVFTILVLLYAKIQSQGSYLSKFTSQVANYKLPANNFQLLGANCNDNSQTSETKLRQPVINVGILDYDISLRNEFLQLVELKVEDTDSRLIELTRKMIDPPSDHMTKFARNPVKTPQAEEIDQLLNMKGGFFLECGALDGERSSNTIWLEKHKQWTGLLVEMDPYYYTQLRGKNRHSFSINACLSTTRRPEMMYFKESGAGQGQLVGVNETKNSKDFNKIRSTPCIPITTMLLALEQKHIDFLSLDVEGFELPILLTMRWDLINVRSIAVEYAHSPKKELKSYIEAQGFKLIKEMPFSNYRDILYLNDFIFLKE